MFPSLSIVIACTAVALVHKTLSLYIPSSSHRRSDPVCSPLTAPSENIVHYRGIDAASRTNNGADESTEWDISILLSRSTDQLLHPRAGSDFWSTAVLKGQSLWSNLQQVLQDSASVDTPICDLQSRWNVGLEDLGLGKLSSFWAELLPAGTIEAQQSEATFYNLVVTAPKLDASKPTFDTEYFYSYNNEYSPRYGIIDVLQIEGKRSDLDTGEERRAPDRWSDVSWALWKYFCEKDDKDPATLTWILHDVVSNLETWKIQQEIFRRRGANPPGIRERTERVFPESEEFLALLGTPNVIGTIYMLMSKANALGRKIVKSIGLYENEQQWIYLYIELEKWNAPESGPIPHGTIDTE